MKNRPSKKSYFVLAILFIIIFAIIMIGTSFAFFTARVSGIFNKITIKSAELGTASADSTSVSLYVSAKDMRLSDGSNSYKAYKESEDAATLTLRTTTGSSDGMLCTYDLVYRPYNVYIKSSANTHNYKEFTISGYQEILSGSHTTATGSIPEFDLTSVTTETVLVSNATLRVEGSNKTGEAIWYIRPRYYNLAIRQDDNADKTFGGAVEVARLACVSF